MFFLINIKINIFFFKIKIYEMKQTYTHIHTKKTLIQHEFTFLQW